MRIRSKWEDLGCVAIFVAASMLCANAQAGPVTLGIGLDYAKGKYGEPKTTEDFYIPFSLTYQHGAWKTKLVVPFLAIRGNGEVVGGRVIALSTINVAATVAAATVAAVAVAVAAANRVTMKSEQKMPQTLPPNPTPA